MVTRGEVSDVRDPFPGAQAQDGLDVRDVSLRRWSHRVCEVSDVSNSHVVQVQQTPSSCQTGRACEVRDLSNPHVTHVGLTASVPGCSFGRTASQCARFGPNSHARDVSEMQVGHMGKRVYKYAVRCNRPTERAP